MKGNNMKNQLLKKEKFKKIVDKAFSSNEKHIFSADYESKKRNLLKHSINHISNISNNNNPISKTES